MQKTALLFAGQGAQSAGMGKDLAETFPTARDLFERGNHILGYDLRSICFQGPEPELTKTEHAQPGIFLVSWIAFVLLKETAPHFHFEATAGLSLGEFTALAAGGSFSFEEGLRVVRRRGEWMQEACESSRGTMAALLGMEEAAARAVCEESGAEIANLNCPGQIVISGSIESVAKASELAKARGAKRALPLPVAGAYHSRLMAPAQPKLRAFLENIAIQAPTVDVASNVTGKFHGQPREILDAVVAQVTASVRWEENIRSLLANGFTRFVELGPGTALSGFLKRIEPKAVILNVADKASLEKTAQAIAAG